MRDVQWVKETLACTRVRRLGACGIDVLIFLTFLGVPAALAILWIRRTSAQEDLAAGLLILLILLFSSLLWLIVPFVYYTAFHIRRGQTPGKRALGLHVVSHRTGERATKSRIVGRQLALEGSLLGAQLLTSLTEAANPFVDSNLVWDTVADGVLIMAPMLLHPEGRGWHDLIAGTVVVDSTESRL